MDGSTFYRISIAVKLHLYTDYDLIKYHGKVPNIESRYDKLPSKAIYEKWANKCLNPSDAYNLCISNFMGTEDQWIFGPTGNANRIYKSWLLMGKEWRTFFRKDLEFIRSTLITKKADHASLFCKTPSGQFPPILQLYLGKRILPDTILMLNDYENNFLLEFMKEYNDDPLISKELFKLKKYRPFMQNKSIDCKDMYEGTYKEI